MPNTDRAARRRTLIFRYRTNDDHLIVASAEEMPDFIAVETSVGKLARLLPHAIRRFFQKTEGGEWEVTGPQEIDDRPQGSLVLSVRQV